MNINPTAAATAYQQALNRAVEPSTGDGMDDGVQIGAAGGGGVSFTDMLRSAVESGSDTMTKSENIGLQAVAQKADIVDVVTAVNAAEVTLQTVVAVRDRMVQAYQEIMRMPI
jgi:flagellar hook-basal body complex protein FliE